ncbi:nad dependent epimerase dehydratase [Colletotrichum chrysophilum]|uniref:Nad dependent epimerase dehydratase n=1 Tax=Colletotrichum chrysophilum TaxID=1836956 RepID=A0AAD9APL5_9PEZI|nr:nad dependent epimerase dehydratase [Colletotrichum chrysophilum]
MGQGHSRPKPGTKFRVIGAGMSRTGTKTFAQALETLIGPVHDGGAEGLVGTAEVRKRWLEVMELATKKDKTLPEKKRLEWLLAELMEGYSATVDAPCIWLVPEILELYPDAVVIATTRDKESWWKSAQTISSLVDWPWLPFFARPLPVLNSFVTWGPLVEKTCVSRLGFKGFQCAEVLETHEAFLRRVVPPEKLFFYRVRDGWGPLCEMLKLPVPAQPFPHNNKPEDVKMVGRIVVAVGSVAWGVVLGGALTCTWVAWRLGSTLLSKMGNGGFVKLLDTVL